MRNDERVAKIELRIRHIDSAITMLRRVLTVTRYPKPIKRRIRILEERRDNWEERLILAELGTPKVYSRSANERRQQ